MPNPPPPSQSSSSSSSSSPPQVDWAPLVSGLGNLFGDAVKRLSDRASQTSQGLRAGTYDRDTWLDDVKWFWEKFAQDADAAVELCRSHVPKG
jgi:hypothetical protein